ncbi:CocE/NonD family hydrolase C-terminal non-catalytic domain-containing protein [Streptomyces sp. 8L]|uniref:CocE/NonD family hydrolase C-terminal non-catalytic domain-containing protein n=1 Tax=Streptomyces sp. 8L TaxID=2877242 RepID=UPI0021E5E089|nr:CocE/NonD family hydrolase C-terminal non-catalytic domain-containing protein [Streptomyces sp. 8L]
MRKRYASPGPAKVNLWIASSAEDTDFFVRLTDVEPSGFAGNVAEGSIRTRYRGGRLLAHPRRADRARVRNGSHGTRLSAGLPDQGAGHEPSFPKFTRNLNSRAVPEFGTDADIVVARQTILHGPDTASRLSLNIISAPNGRTPYVAMAGVAEEQSQSPDSGRKMA